MVVDTKGPSASLIPPLEAAYIEVTVPGVPDIAAAAQALYNACSPAERTIRHLDHPGLNAAVAGARQRPLGDGGWACGRRRRSTWQATADHVQPRGSSITNG